jgi:hypothetical protein
MLESDFFEDQTTNNKRLEKIVLNYTKLYGYKFHKYYMNDNVHFIQNSKINFDFIIRLFETNKNMVNFSSNNEDLFKLKYFVHKIEEIIRIHVSNINYNENLNEDDKKCYFEINFFDYIKKEHIVFCKRNINLKYISDLSYTSSFDEKIKYFFQKIDKNKKTEKIGESYIMYNNEDRYIINKNIKHLENLNILLNNKEKFNNIENSNYLNFKGSKKMNHIVPLEKIIFESLQYTKNYENSIVDNFWKFKNNLQIHRIDTCEDFYDYVLKETEFINIDLKDEAKYLQMKIKNENCILERSIFYDNKEIREFTIKFIDIRKELYCGLNFKLL